jgi:flagellin
MSLRINQNISALIANRNLAGSTTGVSKSLEKLSSGLRINRAADDAAGLGISEKIRAQVKGLGQAQRNAQDGISLIQTTEGALQETSGILIRMRELAVQAANGSITSSDRQNIMAEIEQLIDEVDRIAETTQFNSMNLISGTAVAATITGSATGVTATVSSGDDVVSGAYSLIATGAGNSFTYELSFEGSVIASASSTVASAVVTHNGLVFTMASNTNGTGAFTATAASATTQSFSFHIGANANQTTAFDVNPMDATSLGIDLVDVSDVTGANTAIGLIDAGIASVSSQRSTLGAAQNRLEYTINNLSVASENLSASESRIRDVDMALEMTNYTRNQIMTQAGVAMLAQANMSPQMILSLLQ